MDLVFFFAVDEKTNHCEEPKRKQERDCKKILKSGYPGSVKQRQSYLLLLSHIDLQPPFEKHEGL